MSKIQKVTSFTMQTSAPQNLEQITPNQNFRGGLSDLPKANKELDAAKKIVLDSVEAKINKKVGRTGSFFAWLSDTSGEVQTQSINGIFTTTLAPLMIVCNPFAKKKTKEDKQYLALRQPISALIALSGGLAMTFAVNNFQDKIYNDGFVESIDLRVTPSKDYIKRSFNKNYKEAKKNGKLKEFLALYDKDVSDMIKSNGFKNGKVQTKYKRACYKQGYTKKVQDQRIELFTTLISEKPQNIKIDDSKNIVIGNTNLQNGHLMKAPNLNSQNDLDKYIEKNSLYNRTLGDLMKEKFKFEFYEDAEVGDKYKTHINDKKLSSTKALDFLEEMGLIEEGSVSETELKEILMKYRQNSHKEELAKALNGSTEKAGTVFNIVGSDTSRNIQMTVGEDLGKAKSISLGQFFHVLGYKVENGQLQKLMDSKMSVALLRFKDIFKDKLKGINSKTELKYFAKNLIKKSVSKMNTDAKTHKFYIGIVINLFTTAVTCTILNWAYPRFVETFFPKLAKSGTKQKQSAPPEIPKQIEFQKGGNK